ncbi:hypothetical protein ACHAXR_011793 [Thalassiosira sp. AJA248-18]
MTTPPPLISYMSIIDIKRELMDLNDSSFVFNQRDELECALRSARKLNSVKMPTGLVSLVSTISSSSSLAASSDNDADEAAATDMTMKGGGCSTPDSVSVGSISRGSSQTNSVLPSTLMPKKEIKDPHSESTTLNFMLELVGADLLSYLAPRELFLFSIANQRLFHEIQKNVALIFAQHATPLAAHFEFGEWDSSRVCFREGYSYPSEEKLLHFLFKMMGDLDFVGYHDRKSLSQARHDLQGLSSWTADFQGQHGREPVSFEYENNSNKESAMQSVKSIIESGFGYTEWRVIGTQFAQKVGFIEDWLCYIIAQSDASVGTWSWSCPQYSHKDLGHGTAGTGVMVSISGFSIEISAAVHDCRVLECPWK